MKYIAKVNEQEYEIGIDREGEIVVDGKTYAIDFSRLRETETVSVLINNRSLAALVEARNDQWEVLIHGELYSVEVQDERSYRLSQARAKMDGDGESVVKSPMPGLILKLLVEEGDVVSRGDKVVILESMKMENELRAASDGVVLRVHVAAGDSVEKAQTLVTIGEPQE